MALLDHLRRGMMGRDPCIFLFEAQSSFAKEDIERFCAYANRAEDLYHLPAFLIVFWFLRDRRPPASSFTRSAGGIVTMQRHYISIDVYRLSAHVILESGNAMLLPLVPVMQGADTEVDTAVMQHIAANPDVEVRQTLALLAAVLIARERGNVWAEDLLRRWIMESSLVEESPLYQKWVAEAEAKGLAVGEAKGEIEGLIEALHLILGARFGTLDAALLVAIRQADTATLRDAIAHSASASLEAIALRFGITL